MIVGIFIGASLGALLTAAGLIMAAPAILPAIGIACGFAFLGAILFRPLGKKISDCILSPNYKDNEEEFDFSDTYSTKQVVVDTQSHRNYSSPILRQGVRVSDQEAEVKNATCIRSVSKGVRPEGNR